MWLWGPIKTRTIKNLSIRHKWRDDFQSMKSEQAKKRALRSVETMEQYGRIDVACQLEKKNIADATNPPTGNF